MKVKPLRLDGLKAIQPKVLADERGLFFESYRLADYEKEGITCPFVQDNHSVSRRGTLRGMHFQSHPGQAKLICVAVGKIFDVAVDIRPASPTFGQWEGVILDGERHNQLFIPSGFAHGFCVLSEIAHVLYKCSAVYDPATETGFCWNDPFVAIDWPVTDPVLSQRDQEAPLLKEVVTR